MTGTAILTAEQGRMLGIIDASHKLADSTKDQYKRALVNYWRAGHKITDTEALAQYAQTVSNSTRAFLKSAIRKVTEGAAHQIKATVTPETIDQAQAALMRIEAIQETIEVEATKGQRAHTWLNQSEVRALFSACGNGIVGQRDRIVIGLLVAAGLRRSEAASLRFEDIKRQPVGDKFRTVLDILGKGSKARVVPISETFARALEDWRQVCGGSGYVCRSLGMSQELGDCLSSVAIFNIVQKRAAKIGFDGESRPELQAHDLRRTFAQLGHEAGIPITQISKLLGHSSVAVTQRYLNLELNLDTTISDFIPFSA